MRVMRRRLRWIVVALAAVMLCACAVGYVLRRPSLQREDAPARAVICVPADRQLRFVSYNILHNRRGRDTVIAEILQAKPDFVLLQELESRDVDTMARALLMRQVYYPSVNLAGSRGSWGNAILSRY